MRLDAHHHIWDDSVRNASWARPFPVLHRAFDLDDLAALLADNAIDAGILVQTGPSYEETRRFLAQAALRESVWGVVGWAGLAGSGLGDELDDLLAGPGGGRLVGVRHQVEDERADWLDDPKVRAGLAEVARRGLGYDLLVRTDQLPSAVRAVDALPSLRFVLDHAAKPPVGTDQVDEWRHGISALARRPNCAVKLSGLATVIGPGWTAAALRPYADHVLSAFGPDRVMYGSDWPVCLIAASYDQVVTLAGELTDALSAAERELVFGGTAESWYAR